MSDLLCIVLDHSILEADEGVNDARLERHREFGLRVRESLTHHWTVKPPAVPLKVHLLLNKKDRWGKAPDNQTARLIRLLDDEATAWRGLLPHVDRVTSASHSNTDAADILSVVTAVEGMCTAHLTQAATHGG